MYHGQGPIQSRIDGWEGFLDEGKPKPDCKERGEDGPNRDPDQDERRSVLEADRRKGCAESLRQEFLRMRDLIGQVLVDDVVQPVRGERLLLGADPHRDQVLDGLRPLLVV